MDNGLEEGKPGGFVVFQGKMVAWMTAECRWGGWINSGGIEEIEWQKFVSGRRVDGNQVFDLGNWETSGPIYYSWEQSWLWWRDDRLSFGRAECIGLVGHVGSSWENLQRMILWYRYMLCYMNDWVLCINPLLKNQCFCVVNFSWNIITYLYIV